MGPFAETPYLIALPDPFNSLFSEDVWTFIKRKAESLSTIPGYVTRSLLTSTAFVAGMQSTLNYESQQIPLNLFTMFVGPPTTGKSQAVKECATSPMSAVARETDTSNVVIFTYIMPQNLPVESTGDLRRP